MILILVRDLMFSSRIINAAKELGREYKIVRDPADVAKVRAGRAAVLGTHRAAGTLIIGGLSNPAWKVEVEGIAVA